MYIVFFLVGSRVVGISVLIVLKCMCVWVGKVLVGISSWLMMFISVLSLVFSCVSFCRIGLLLLVLLVWCFLMVVMFVKVERLCLFSCVSELVLLLCGSSVRCNWLLM